MNSYSPLEKIEKQLGTIWAETLYLRSVGSDESFFALNGSSLAAAEIIARVNEAFALDLALGTLLDAPTIKQLAQVVDLAKREGQTGNLPPVHAASRAQVFPLSAAQRSTWFLMNLAPDLPLYHMAVLIKLPEPVDVAALEQTINTIIRRHEIWRTTFGLVGGSYAQIIHDDLPVKVRILNEAHSQAIALEEARQPFDLERGPLIRATLIPAGLVLTVHHLIFDGYSLTNLFLPEFMTLYRGFASGSPARLPTPALHYADYTIWQRDVCTEDRLRPTIRFWKEHVRDLPDLILSAAPSPGKPTFRGVHHTLQVELTTVETLRALGEQSGATLFMVLLAIFKILLWRQTGQRDIGVFIPVVGRPRPELTQVMGFLATAVLARDTIRGEMSFTALLAQVRATVLAAYDHQELSLRRLLLLMQAAAPGRRGEVLFAFNPLSRRLDAGWAVKSDLDLGVAKLDLTFELTENEDGITGVFEYNLDVLDGPAITRMADTLQRLMTLCVQYPGEPLDALSARLDS